MFVNISGTKASDAALTSRAIDREQRALVIFPGALGDLVCLLPAVEALASRHRGTRFELMAAAPLANFLAGRSVFAGGHSIDRAEVATLFADRSEALDQARRLFGPFSRIDSFFATDNPAYRRRLTLACVGAVGLHRFRPAGAGHVVAGYASELGLTLDCAALATLRGQQRSGRPSRARIRARIFPTPDDFAKSGEVLNSVGLSRGRFIVVMPGSGSRSKNWPAEQFAALAAAISHHKPGAILLGPAEEDLKPVFEARGCRVLAGLELPVAAALIASASGFVGNDSGVSHMAAALGVPGVVIFGPTERARWAPLGPVTVVARRRLDQLKCEEVAAALGQIMRSCEPLHVRVDCPGILT